MNGSKKIEWVLDTANLFTRHAIYSLGGNGFLGVVVGFKTGMTCTGWDTLHLMILRDTGQLDVIDYSDVTLGDKTRPHY